MADKIGVAVIGTGFGASAHAPAVVNNPDMELVAFVSGRLERAKAAAEQFGVDAYFDDYRKAIAMPEVDAITIASPPNMHYDMAMAAIKAGKHVLCEKQMAMNIREAGEMTQAAEAAGLANALVFEFRYLPERRAMRRLIQEEGYVGKVQTANIKCYINFPYATPERAWMANTESGGGFIGAFGSHCIDTARYILGDFSGVFGQLDYHARSMAEPGQPPEIESEDGFRGVFNLESGGAGVLGFHLSVQTPELPGPGLTIEVVGTKGTLILTHKGPILGGHPGEPVEQLDLPSMGLSRETIRTCVPALMGDFAAVCKGESRPNMPTFRDGLRCQEFMDALVISDGRRAWIDLPEGLQR